MNHLLLILRTALTNPRHLLGSIARAIAVEARNQSFDRKISNLYGDLRHLDRTMPLDRQSRQREIIHKIYDTYAQKHQTTIENQIKSVQTEISRTRDAYERQHLQRYLHHLRSK